AWSAAVLGLDGGQDLLGMIVDARAAAAGLSGLRGDGAVVTGEASGGIGDPTEKRYGAHGDGSSGGGAVHNRIPEVHPRKNQEGPGRILPSVNSKRTRFAHLGTIPVFRGQNPTMEPSSAAGPCEQSNRDRRETRIDGFTASPSGEAVNPSEAQSDRGASPGN